MLTDRVTLLVEDELRTTEMGGAAWRPPRQTEAEAIDQAMGMIER